MKIEDLKVGTIAYRICDNAPDGDILENFDEDSPLTTMFGVGHIMMSFYKGLIGLEPGDNFSFSIPPDKAFGQHDPNLITKVPLEMFIDNGKLREDLLAIGGIVDIEDNDGNKYKGTIIEVNSNDTVTMDFNTPLAGHTLFVSGKVIDVRNATIDEMNKIVEERKKKGGFEHHNHHHN